MSTERLIYGLREKARQVFPEDGIVSAFATPFERDAARRMLHAADVLTRLQAAEKAWADLGPEVAATNVEALRALAAALEDRP